MNKQELLGMVDRLVAMQNELNEHHGETVLAPDGERSYLAYTYLPERHVLVRKSNLGAYGALCLAIERILIEVTGSLERARRVMSQVYEGEVDAGTALALLAYYDYWAYVENEPAELHR